MKFDDMKSALDDNTSMDKKSTVTVKSVPRTYRIRIDIEEALVKAGYNKNKLVNNLLEKHLKSKGEL